MIGSDIEDPDDEEEDELIDQTWKLEIAEESLPREVRPTDQEAIEFRYCCLTNNVQALEELLDMSHDPIKLINGKDEQGNLGLALACMEGHRDIVPILHKRGAHIESINEHGRTPLIEALFYGRGVTADYLV